MGMDVGAFARAYGYGRRRVRESALPAKPEHRADCRVGSRAVSKYVSAFGLLIKGRSCDRRNLAAGGSFADRRRSAAHGRSCERPYEPCPGINVLRAFCGRVREDMWERTRTRSQGRMGIDVGAFARAYGYGRRRVRKSALPAKPEHRADRACRSRLGYRVNQIRR